MKKKTLAFFRWEDKENGDFPFYQGKPITIGPLAWVFLLVAIAAAFTLEFTSEYIVNFFTAHLHIPRFAITALLVVSFPLIMLAAVRLVAGKHVGLLFRKVRGKDVIFVLWWTVVSLIAAGLIAGFVEHVLHTKTVSDVVLNSLTGDAPLKAFIDIMLQLPFQMLGEELSAIITFLLFLALFAGYFKLSRKTSIVIAWILSSLLFGLYHFHAYDWHLAQMLIVIGGGRLFLTFAYLKTKNLWVSFGTHFLYDTVSIVFTTFIISAR